MKILIQQIAAFQRLGQDAVLLFLRLTVGWQMFLTGKAKLSHLDRITRFFDSLHIPAPGFHALLIGSIEMLGGLALLIGLGARGFSVLVAAAMMGAYLTAHRDEAFASVGDFIEAPPFPYLVVAWVVLVFGAGRSSLDHVIVRQLAKHGQTVHPLIDRESSP